MSRAEAHLLHIAYRHDRLHTVDRKEAGRQERCGNGKGNSQSNTELLGLKPLNPGRRIISAVFL